MRRDPRLPVAALAAGLLLAGCGAPGPSAARDIPAQDVPYGLLVDDAPDGTVTTPTATAAPQTQLYLVDAQDRLVGRPFPTTTRSPRAAAAELLAAVVAGPSTEQLGEGLSSTLAQGATLTLVDLTDGVASVDVSFDVRDPSADRLPLLAGEVVLALTSVPGVDAVQLLADGRPLDAPLPGGARTSQPVTAADYAALAAP